MRADQDPCLLAASSNRDPLRLQAAAPLPRQAMSDLLGALDEVMGLERHVVVSAAAPTFKSFLELATALRKAAQDAGARQRRAALGHPTRRVPTIYACVVMRLTKLCGRLCAQMAAFP